MTVGSPSQAPTANGSASDVDLINICPIHARDVISIPRPPRFARRVIKSPPFRPLALLSSDL